MVMWWLKRKILVGIVFWILFVVIGGLIIRYTLPNVCGIGEITRWKLTPGPIAKTYVTLTTANTHDALLSDHIRTVEMTDKGVFVGYAGELADNLSFITPTTIETCQSRDTHIQGHINDILYDKSHNQVWIATDGRGLYRLSDGIWRNYTSKDGLADDRQYALALNQDHLYVTTQAGISVFSYETDSWSTATELANTTLSAIDTLLFASSGDIWMGSIHGGVVRKTNKGWKTYVASPLAGEGDIQVVPEMKSNEVRVITEAPDGTIWVGSDPGLAVYDPLMDRWSDREPGQKSGVFGTMGIAFDDGKQAWVTGTGGTYVLSEHGGNAHWSGGLSLSLGIDGGVFDQRTVVIGTDGDGLYIGNMANEAP